jgi:hypothetical protein
MTSIPRLPLCAVWLLTAGCGSDLNAVSEAAKQPQRTVNTSGTAPLAMIVDDTDRRLPDELGAYAGVWRWRDPGEPRAYYVIDQAGAVHGYHGKVRLKEVGKLSVDGATLRIDSVGEPIWFTFEVAGENLFVEKAWFDGEKEVRLPDGPGWEKLRVDQIPPHLQEP